MIHLDKPISSSGYGIAVVSAQTFQELCKEHRIRSKKMLTYFDKNHNVFYDFIKKGAFVPIPRIRAHYYKIFITINDNRTTYEEWDFIPTEESFFLEVKDEALWVCSFEQMENWKYKDLENCTTIETYYYLSYEGERYTAYGAAKYAIPNGKYKIKIIGLRSKKVEKEEKFRKGYAFLIQLEKVDNIPNIADSTQLDFSKLFE